jgi:hypothetical protein
MNDYQLSSPMTPMQASNMPGEYSFFSFEEIKEEEVVRSKLVFDPEVVE